MCSTRNVVAYVLLTCCANVCLVVYCCAMGDSIVFSCACRLRVFTFSPITNRLSLCCSPMCQNNKHFGTHSFAIGFAFIPPVVISKYTIRAISPFQSPAVLFRTKQSPTIGYIVCCFYLLHFVALIFLHTLMQVFILYMTFSLAAVPHTLTRDV